MFLGDQLLLLPLLTCVFFVYKLLLFFLFHLFYSTAAAADIAPSTAAAAALFCSDSGLFLLNSEATLCVENVLSHGLACFLEQQQQQLCSVYA